MLNLHNKYQFALIAFVLVYLSFGHNIFHAVNPEKFYTTGAVSDALVIGRLVQSREHGILSEQGRMGRFLGLDGDMHENQTKLYLGEVSGGQYTHYDSQFGVQGMLYSSLDRLATSLGISAESRLTLYHTLVAVLFSLILVSLLVMMFDDIGLTAVCLILVSILFSRWQVYYSKSLYWSLPTMFLPMVVVFAACKFEASGRRISLTLLSFSLMLLVMLDALMGYEYITTVMMAAVTPLVYFWMRDNWSNERLIRRMILLGSFALAGFLIALMLHLYQLKVATGNYADAFEIIKERVMARTYTDPEDYAGTAYYESQQTSVFYVLYVYLIKGGTFRLKIPFILWVLMLVNISIKIYRNENAFEPKKVGIIKALIVTSWFSLAASLSWIVLAKSHSEIHTQVNYIVWHLPFMFFAFALFGLYWEDNIKSGIRSVRQRLPGLSVFQK
jgi:hypothetical protein